MKTLLRAAWLAAAALVAGCGGGGDAGGPGGSLKALSGVYTSQLIIDAQGRFVAGASADIPPTYSNYVTLSGVISIDGNQLSSPAISTTQYHCSYTDGAYGCATDRGVAALSGAVDASQNVSLRVTPSLIYPVPEVLYFSRSNFAQELYPNAAMYIVAGRYASAETGSDFTIDQGSARISGKAFTGCTLDGTVYIWNPDKNVYSIIATLSGETCGSIPGKQYDLLGYLATVDGKPQLKLLSNIEGQLVTVVGSR